MSLLLLLPFVYFAHALDKIWRAHRLRQHGLDPGTRRRTGPRTRCGHSRGLRAPARPADGLNTPPPPLRPAASRPTADARRSSPPVRPARHRDSLRRPGRGSDRRRGSSAVAGEVSAPPIPSYRGCRSRPPPSRHRPAPAVRGRRRLTAAAAPRGPGRPRREPSDRRPARSPVDSTSARTHRGSGSSTGAGPGPAEPAHAVGRQHRDRLWIGVDLCRNRAPSRAGNAPAGAVPPPPGQVGQNRDQRDATRHRPRHRADPLPQSPAPSAAAGHRVAGHRQRHPLLPVAQHRQARRRVHDRPQQRQPRPGGHGCGHQHADRSQQQQRLGRSAPPQCRRTPSVTMASSTTVATRAKSVVRVAGTRLGVPDAAEAGQAAQGAEAGFGAGRERRQTGGLCVAQCGAEHRGGQPR